MSTKPCRRKRAKKPRAKNPTIHQQLADLTDQVQSLLLAVLHEGDVSWVANQRKSQEPRKQGWSCPKCGTVWSPDTKSCERCESDGGAPVVTFPPDWPWQPVSPWTTKPPYREGDIVWTTTGVTGHVLPPVSVSWSVGP